MVSNKDIKQKLGDKREGKNINGYLVCDTCGGSYKLLSGEKPEDFSSECECGGELKHIDNVENQEKNIIEINATNICPYCSQENEETSKYCQNCGKEINNQSANKNELPKKSSTLLIVFGYLFAILGGFLYGIGLLVGLIIGIILYRRAGPDRIHGIIIIALSVVILLVVVLLAALLIYRAYFALP